MIKPPHAVGHLRQVDEGHEPWQRYAAIARVGALAFVAVGSSFLREPGATLWLPVIYVSWFALSIRHLAMLYYGHRVTPLHTWLQLVLDFAVVAVTIAVTQGPESFFTFIFVIVIVEAGLLLGMTQGFVVATAAASFMATVFLYWPAEFDPLTTVESKKAHQLEQVYNFLILTLGFYLTAFVSGYWYQRINRMERFQREILDNLNSGFLITDVNGIVLVLNEAADTILGLTDGVGIGLPVDEVLRPESGGECPIQTALRSGRDYTSYEFRIVTAAGTPRLLGLTTNRVVSPKEEVTGLIASFTDLTMMDELREEMRQQDRLAVVGELAAGLAHEIRNPVAAIRGAVDELQNVAGGNIQAERLYRIALRESDHLNEIVTGFLDFAREPEVKREVIDVRQLLEEVTETIACENTGHVLLERPDTFDDESCFVSGDPSQLKQVFVNLARNGIEAMHGEGVLRIGVDHEDGPVIVRFSDEGPGIDPDQITRVFEPFYTTKASGVGMGLAVCMRIITAHNGTLRASNGHGGGCTMTLTLPAAKSEGVLVPV